MAPSNHRQARVARSEVLRRAWAAGSHSQFRGLQPSVDWAHQPRPSEYSERATQTLHPDATPHGLVAASWSDPAARFSRERGLADAIAQVVSFARRTLPVRFTSILAILACAREDMLHAFALHDAADREGLTRAAARGHDHAAEDLDAFLGAFQMRWCTST